MGDRAREHKAPGRIGGLWVLTKTRQKCDVLFERDGNKNLETTAKQPACHLRE